MPVTVGSVDGGPRIWCMLSFPLTLVGRLAIRTAVGSAKSTLRPRGTSDREEVIDRGYRKGPAAAPLDRRILHNRRPSIRIMCLAAFGLASQTGL